MSERTLKPIRCRLCRKPGKVANDFADERLGMGHYEIECPCGVLVWNEKLEAAVALWNRLMRVKK
jgi:hypothetical protein